MYLVEYSQLKGKQIFNHCSGFYSDLEAYDFALKLNMCANIESILISEIDVSFANVLYRNDFVKDSPDTRDKFSELLRDKYAK